MDIDQIMSFLENGGPLILGGGIVCFTLGFIALSFVVGRMLTKSLTGPKTKILEIGVPGEATIVKTWQTGVSINDQPQVGMLLEVRVPGRDPYQVEYKQVVPIIHIPQFQPGAVMPVKVDPNDPAKIALDIYE